MRDWVGEDGAYAPEVWVRSARRPYLGFSIHGSLPNGRGLPLLHQIFSVPSCEPHHWNPVKIRLSSPRDVVCKRLLWRGSQVVRHGSAKAVFVGSIPTLASFSFQSRSSKIYGTLSESGLVTKVAQTSNKWPVSHSVFPMFENVFISLPEITRTEFPFGVPPKFGPVVMRGFVGVLGWFRCLAERRP